MLNVNKENIMSKNEMVFEVDENVSVQEQLLIYIKIAKHLGILSDDPDAELAFIDQMLGGDYSMLEGQ
jgi:hypothetical protein